MLPAACGAPARPIPIDHASFGLADVAFTIARFNQKLKPMCAGVQIASARRISIRLAWALFSGAIRARQSTGIPRPFLTADRRERRIFPMLFNGRFQT